MTASRLVRFAREGSTSVGLVVGDEVVELALGWSAALACLGAGDRAGLDASCVGAPLPLASVALQAPLEHDSDVYCVGLNYLEHRREAVELVDELPAVPIIFAKSPRAMAPPTADLLLPRHVSAEFDFEAELGVVIGLDAVDVAEEDAWRHVAGYCVINDITARDLQRAHQQWHLGKNVPASTPIGPWVIGRDALPLPPDVEVTLSVNGVEKQRSRTSLLIHGLPELVALLSRVTHLRAGDVIATGTPAGVGFKRTPPEFLQDGDVVVTDIAGVGRLTNRVRTTGSVPAVPFAPSGSGAR
ncbi:MAG: 5-carboxymethyl-2-hydroxymuconate delta-isomerase [Acidimicrobiales bacterium]|nr:5-carboxymethyl-2-hydroxymuconate delta-isomerase [Acidimicrobiales bacterium]